MSWFTSLVCSLSDKHGTIPFLQWYKMLLRLSWSKHMLISVNTFSQTNTFSQSFTGDSRHVDFAYLDTITYVEVIFHSQHFFSIYLCIATPSMSKTVNMKQRVSRGDFSCPRRIFYYICYVLCRSQKSALTWAPYCLFRLLPEVRKYSKQKSKTK